jgi:hypothetical protein
MTRPDETSSSGAEDVRKLKACTDELSKKKLEAFRRLHELHSQHQQKVVEALQRSALSPSEVASAAQDFAFTREEYKKELIDGVDANWEEVRDAELRVLAVIGKSRIVVRSSNGEKIPLALKHLELLRQSFGLPLCNKSFLDQVEKIFQS